MDNFRGSIGWLITNQPNLGIKQNMYRKFMQPDKPNSRNLQSTFKIILFILQRPTHKTATQLDSHHRIKLFILQWPTEKTATPTNNISNGPTARQFRVRAIELNKVEEDAVVPEESKFTQKGP